MDSRSHKGSPERLRAERSFQDVLQDPISLQALFKPWWAPAGLFPCCCPVRPPFQLVAQKRRLLRLFLWLLIAVNILSKLAVLRVYTERGQSTWFTLGVILFALGCVAPVVANRRHLLLLYNVFGRTWIRRTCTKYELEDEPGVCVTVRVW